MAGCYRTATENIGLDQVSGERALDSRKAVSFCPLSLATDIWKILSDGRPVCRLYPPRGV